MGQEDVLELLKKEKRPLTPSAMSVILKVGLNSVEVSCRKLYYQRLIINTLSVNKVVVYAYPVLRSEVYVQGLLLNKLSKKEFICLRLFDTLLNGEISVDELVGLKIENEKRIFALKKENELIEQVLT